MKEKLFQDHQAQLQDNPVEEVPLAEVLDQVQEAGTQLPQAVDSHLPHHLANNQEALKATSLQDIQAEVVVVQSREAVALEDIGESKPPTTLTEESQSVI